MNETAAGQTDVVGGNVLGISHGTLEMFGVGHFFGDLAPSIALPQGSDMACTPTTPASILAPFTAELWTQVNGGGVQVALSTRTPNDFGLQIGTSATGALSCTIGNGAAFLAIITPGNPVCGVQSRFHHIALVAGVGNWFAYIDGTQVATGALAAGAILYDANHHIIVGSYNGVTNFLNSTVSRIALYDKAVAAADLLNHYENGLFGQAPLPAGYIPGPAASLNDAILRSVRKVF